MNHEVVNALELVMLMICVVARIAGTTGIVWITATSNISNGWKVFIIILTVLVGLGFNVKYQNPNALTTEIANAEHQ